MAYKNTFLVYIKKWFFNNNQMRSELRLGIIEEAQGSIMHVPMEDDGDPDGPDWRFLVQRYEDIFCTKESSSQAKSVFRTSSQTPSESISGWYTRIKSLYLAAKPLNAVYAEMDEDLVSHFLENLYDKEVSKAARMEEPKTLMAAKLGAERAASIYCGAGRRAVALGLPQTEDAKINQMKKGNGEGRREKKGKGGGQKGACHYCGQKDHFKRDCPNVDLEALKKFLPGGKVEKRYKDRKPDRREGKGKRGGDKKKGRPGYHSLKDNPRADGREGENERDRRLRKVIQISAMVAEQLGYGREDEPTDDKDEDEPMEEGGQDDESQDSDSSENE